MLTKTSPSRGANSPRVTGFYDDASGSAQYLIVDEATGKGAILDPVLDFDPAHARTRTDSAAGILDRARAEGVEVEWILDTHPHADHMTASAWLKKRTGATTAIGAKVREIADLWEGIYGTPGAFDPARAYDRLFADGETFRIGGIEVRVMLSPGHTLGSITYVAGDAAFVHDTFMQPDAGTARADFPGGSAATLWESLQEILALPDDTRLFVGHDYGTDDRPDPAWEATVAEQRRTNIHLAGGTTKDDYVARRDARDATLPLPDRMLYALQVNLRGGRLPPPEDGRSFFRIPANCF